MPQTYARTGPARQEKGPSMIPKSGNRFSEKVVLQQ
jgi:hypothetical protein